MDPLDGVLGRQAKELPRQHVSSTLEGLGSPLEAGIHKEEAEGKLTFIHSNFSSQAHSRVWGLMVDRCSRPSILKMT